MQPLRQIPLLLLALPITACSKPATPPGEAARSFLIQTATTTHAPIVVQQLSFTAPTVKSPVTKVRVGNREIFLNAPIRAFSVNRISLPINVLLRGQNYEFTKTFTNDNESDANTSSPSPVMVDTKLLHRIDITPPKPLAEIVLSGNDRAFGDNFVIVAPDFSFSYGAAGNSFGLLRSTLANPAFERDLCDALVAAGHPKIDASNAIQKERDALLQLSDREFLHAALASDAANLAKESDLSKSIRSAFLQWRIDPVWAVSTNIGNHEFIMIKRVWRAKELPFSILFEEFNDDGSEFAHGSLSVADTPDTAEVVSRISTMVGKVK
jgi:hypothetical protein